MTRRTRKPKIYDEDHLPGSQETVAQPQNSDDSATTGDGGGALLSTAHDLRAFQALRGRKDWEIPETAFAAVPKSLEEIASDPKQKPRTRISAMRELRALQRDNVAKDRGEILSRFNPSVQGALAPQPPQREDEPEVIDGECVERAPIAFIEAPAAEDAQATLDILKELGIADQIVDQPSNGNGSGERRS